MAKVIFAANALIGGISGCLDDILHTALEDGNVAIVTDASANKFYVFSYDASEAGVESSPDIIIPDSNITGTGAWVKADIDIDEVNAHTILTNAHSATDAAIASRIILRDAAGRAKVVAPSVAADIALKSTVTADIATHDALATAHGVIAGSDAAGGALTGNVYWEKIGNIVFITWATLTHASGSSATTAAGLIPAAFRPASNHYDTVYVYTLGSLVVLVNTAGTVAFYYYDNTGAARNATQVLAGSTHYRAA